jgi:hypothetical protein
MWEWLRRQTLWLLSFLFCSQLFCARHRMMPSHIPCLDFFLLTSFAPNPLYTSTHAWVIAKTLLALPLPLPRDRASPTVYLCTVGAPAPLQTWR